MSPKEIRQIPRHVAFVMDGNGRWAREQGLPRLAGHRAGAENTRRVLDACAQHGIEIVTLFGFSTENWRRPREEVMGLFKVFEELIGRHVPELHRNGIQLRYLGRLEGLPKGLAEKIRAAVELTKDNDRWILNLAFNYGGKAEIVEATKRVIAAYRRGELGLDALDEGLFGHTSTRRASPRWTSSPARGARSASPTSCSGSQLTPNSTPPPSTGPTSTKRSSRKPCLPTASGRDNSASWKGVRSDSRWHNSRSSKEH